MLENCNCRIREGMDYETLISVVPTSCKMPQYLCSNLDRELNRARAERDRREAYNERRRQAQRS